jgi:exodeoxyribonuclease-3
MVRYSWWSPFAGSRAKNKGWRIDLVLTDPRLQLVSADVLSDVMGSDHAPVEVVL